MPHRSTAGATRLPRQTRVHATCSHTAHDSVFHCLVRRMLIVATSDHAIARLRWTRQTLPRIDVVQIRQAPCLAHARRFLRARLPAWETHALASTIRLAASLCRRSASRNRSPIGRSVLATQPACWKCLAWLVATRHQLATLHQRYVEQRNRATRSPHAPEHRRASAVALDVQFPRPQARLAKRSYTLRVPDEQCDHCTRLESPLPS
mmetsp:Transcript_2769/g.4462  ORF Transcript_2769/g.4462 Transcript_2769/m.4462 type:complete len:207 (+) Transcript_2769:743-1363(+)